MTFEEKTKGNSLIHFENESKVDETMRAFMLTASRKWPTGGRPTERLDVDLESDTLEYGFE